MAKEKPILYFGMGKNHDTAISAIANSGIDCRVIGPCSEIWRMTNGINVSIDLNDDDPILSFKDNNYQGITAIKKFLENYKAKYANVGSSA
jgi:hypothetical protein